MTTLITTLQLLVFGIYVGVVWYKFGIQDAISTSTIKWEGEKKWYFFLCLGTLGILNLFQGMGGWGFGTAVGLLFTGITVDYKQNLAHGYYVHLMGVVMALVLTFVGLGVYYGMWWLIPIYVIGIASIMTDPFHTDSQAKVWWIEILGFILIIFGYYIR